MASAYVAQRRPGPRPRRHVPDTLLSVVYAARRPGPRPRRHEISVIGTVTFSCAQRRPGPRPRRHVRVVRIDAAHEVRSTKAGAETPATRLRIPDPIPADVLRSTKAGAETPATLCTPPRLVEVDVESLNEGRGRDPGDTRAYGADFKDLEERSTKAGAETPATRWPRSRMGASDGSRSTKAGAETPATQFAARWPERPVRPLNEGRGRDPGDTLELLRAELELDLLRSTKAGAETPATLPRPDVVEGGRCAQRRPGPRPRRHPTGHDRLVRGILAQRRPGPRPRRHPDHVTPETIVQATLNEGRGRDPGDTRPTYSVQDQPRSTKAGAETPATPRW